MISDEVLDWHFARLRREAKRAAAELTAQYGDQLPEGARFVSEFASRPVREFRPTSTGLPREDER